MHPCYILVAPGWDELAFFLVLVDAELSATNTYFRSSILAPLPRPQSFRYQGHKWPAREHPWGNLTFRRGVTPLEGGLEDTWGGSSWRGSKRPVREHPMRKEPDFPFEGAQVRSERGTRRVTVPRQCQPTTGYVGPRQCQPTTVH